MSQDNFDEKKDNEVVETIAERSGSRYGEDDSTLNEDDRELEALGYVPSFKREFTNLATVSSNSPCEF